MMPGMGLYCDYCERLCRAYGEWFSWNCHACDFDICNKCLQDSRNAWAIVPPLGDEDLPGIVGVDLSGDWSISMSGKAHSSAPKYEMGKFTPHFEYYAFGLVHIFLPCSTLPNCDSAGLMHLLSLRVET